MSEFEIAAIIAAYALCCLAAFRFADARIAAIASYFAGWLILPVGIYPPTEFAGQLPIDIMPLALPSRMLWTKAALVPGIICLASLLLDARRWRALRGQPLDLAMAAFCLFPLLQGLLTDSAPPAVVQAAYLSVSWGGSWLLGRLYVADSDGCAVFLRTLMWSGVALLPIAVVEAVTGPIVYQQLYGDQPYRADGAVRYLGYRPLALFEDGNQYGLWMALAALAGISMANIDRRYRWIAAVLITASIVSQSVGAIVLLGLGIAVTLRIAKVDRRSVLIGVAVVSVGAITLVALIMIGGHRAVDFGIHTFRAIGRGSFPWRVSQDLKALAIIGRHLLFGAGQWDWWREHPSRPWDLPMLVIGQYGLIGLLLGATATIGPIVYRPRSLDKFDDRWRKLTIIASLAIADALLNSFLFFPVFLVLGGLVTMDPMRPTSKLDQKI